MSSDLLNLCKGVYMNPFIFDDEKCCGLIVSNKISNSIKDLLKKYNIKVVASKNHPNLDKYIADHPDLSIHPVNSKKFIVAKELYDYYKDELKDFDIELIPSYNEILSKYPKDCLLNVGRIGSSYIHNNYTDIRLEDELENNKINHIFVKQGYSKCSTLDLNYDTIITQDKGIHKAVKNSGYNSYLIEPGDILLEGYNTGFIGGVGGLISKNKMLLSGNPKTYTYGDKLINILEEYEIEPIFPDLCFTDIGSIIPIKE